MAEFISKYSSTEFDKALEGGMKAYYGEVSGGGSGGVELTQAEYDALPEEEKNVGLYFITDGEMSEEIVELARLIGGDA